MAKYLNLNFKKKNAFTLLEMVISIGIFIFVATASSVVFNQALNAYRYTTSRMAAAREAELAMDWIIRDIRDSTGPLIAPSDVTQITINTKTVGNVNYQLLLNGSLMRTEGGATSLLARGVDFLIFTYLDAGNVDVPLPENNANVRLVEVVIVTHNDDQEFRLYNLAVLGP